MLRPRYAARSAGGELRFLLISKPAIASRPICYEYHNAGVDRRHRHATEHDGVAVGHGAVAGNRMVGPRLTKKTVLQRRQVVFDLDQVPWLRIRQGRMARDRWQAGRPGGRARGFVLRLRCALRLQSY